MAQSKYIHKSHNVSVLLYYYVCPAKYRRVVFSEAVDNTHKDICLEIGIDNNHVHFLVQSVPTYSPTKIVTIIKVSQLVRYFAKIQKLRNNYGEVNFGQMDTL